MSLRIAVDPPEVELGPGGAVGLTVGIGNASDLVESYGVTVQGLPVGGSVRAVPASLTLRPGESGQVRLTISTDPARPPLAGQTVLGVVVRSPYRPEVLRCEEVVLHSEAAPGLALTLNPEVVGGRRPRAELVVANEGNTALDVELAGRDAEQAVRVAFEPGWVRLPAGGRARVEVTARARRPLSGKPVRRPVTVTASAAGAQGRATLVLAQRPLVPGGALNLAAAAAGVAVLAA
ncbi:MAG TPA: hypothetical protein VFP72_12210, partial [Kineosporiaceae bacterium]|nr:hypothetical protein [Kineosporiaceae bacterium]